MIYDDDDDLFVSQSDEKAFTTADHGRKDALRREIEEKMGPERAAQVQESELKSQVNLQQLKENIAGEQDEETKRLEDSQDDESYEPK
ncbi:MAG: hypothetical protein QF815_00645, partial [Candidatus Peribacteraceae bacterium]|nr:hypothetical protein [Candidatus Peribacteraceae bacterium]